MYVRWKKRRLASGRTSYRAQVVRSVRAGKQVRQKVLAHLGTVYDDQDREAFWPGALRSLDALGVGGDERQAMLDRLIARAGDPPGPCRKLGRKGSRLEIRVYEGELVTKRIPLATFDHDRAELYEKCGFTGYARHKLVYFRFWTQLLIKSAKVMTEKERHRWLPLIDKWFPHPGAFEEDITAEPEKIRRAALESLGFNRAPDRAKLKKRYRRMAHRHHTDRGGCVVAFRHVQAAYDYLIGEANKRT